MQNAKKERELRSAALISGGLCSLMVVATVVLWIMQSLFAIITLCAALLFIPTALMMHVLAERADRAFQRETDQL